METVRGLLDALKASGYELLALLLPGGIAVLAASSALDVQIPGDTLGFAAIAYVLGTAFQGVADFVFKRPRIAARLKPELGAGSRAFALRLLRDRFGPDFPDDAALDVCLTRVEVRRQVYDKFIALRDMTRGLAIATLPVAGFVVYARWGWLTSGSGILVAVKIVGAFACAVIFFLAFLQRYARFHPLAPQVVFGQFIATHLDPPQPTPPASQQKPKEE